MLVPILVYSVALRTLYILPRFKEETMTSLEERAFFQGQPYIYYI